MLGKPLILVVEDDFSIRESLHELLETEGYTTRLAENGKRALEILASNAIIRLILLDLSMPVMDGPAFLREFATGLPDRQNIPVLIMTAAGRQDIPTHPPEQVLRKPLDVDLLMGTIQRFLNPSRHAGQ
jgi:CheY-like chemotaxis protein